MGKRPSINIKAYLRAVVAMALIAAWTLALATGFLLWLAPHGPRAGWNLLLFGVTKHQWGDIHFWISVVAAGITVVHVIIDWRALKGCIRYLTSTHRSRLRQSPDIEKEQ